MLSLTELRRLLRDPWSAEGPWRTDPSPAGPSPGEPSAPPLLVADLSGDVAAPEDVETLGARIADLPLVTVAMVSPDGHPAQRQLGAAFDLAVQSRAELYPVARAVVSRPLASQALVKLLRGGTARSLEDGLFAESVTYGLLQAGPEFAAWLAHRGPPRRVRHRGDPVLELERRSDRLVVTLSHPERRNAFGVAMRDAFCEGLAVACADPSITDLELRAAGPDFCSGGDLDEFGTLPDPATAHQIRMTRSPARWLSACADRATAYVHGACVGAGIELPAFCARVVAQPDAWFSLPEVGMGLIPGAGGTVSLPRRIGRQRTAWMALTGTRVDAATALAWGLVDAVDPD